MLRALLLTLALFGVALGDVTLSVRSHAEGASCCGDGESEVCCCAPGLGPGARAPAPPPGGSCCKSGDDAGPALPRIVAGCGCGADHGPGGLFVHHAPSKIGVPPDAWPPCVPGAAAAPPPPLPPAGRSLAPETPPPRGRRVGTAA